MQWVGVGFHTDACLSSLAFAKDDRRCGKRRPPFGSFHFRAKRCLNCMSTAETGRTCPAAYPLAMPGRIWDIPR